MFHEGERFIPPTRAPPCAPVSVGQTKTIDSQHTQEEMSYVFLLTDTNLHGGGDVGQREALEVGEQAGRDGRRLRVRWCGRNYNDAKKHFRVMNAIMCFVCIAEWQLCIYYRWNSWNNVISTSIWSHQRGLRLNWQLHLLLNLSILHNLVTLFHQ